MNTPRVIRLNGEDNVVIAIDLVNQGDPAHGLTARQRIRKGHKMAIEPIREGEPVKKFSQIIGFAKRHIAPGEWVHEHNVGLHDFARDYRFAEDAHDDGLLPPRACARPSRATCARTGATGTRNYIGILTSGELLGIGRRDSSPTAVERSGIARRLPGESTASSPIVHGTGCGHAAYGEGFEVLRRTQWGYASHPNFGGVVMVGLGCEVFQIGRMKKEYGHRREATHFQTMTIQETGGTKKTVEGDRGAIRDMLPIAAAAQPRDAPRLRARARFAMRRLGRLFRHHREPGARRGVRPARSSHGGTAMLSETPEIYGAEHLLTRRAVDPRGRREARRAHPLVGGVHGQATAAR